MQVAIINKKELTDSEIATVETIAGRFSGKFSIENYGNAKGAMPRLLVEVKKYNQKDDASMRCKYSVHAKILAPSLIITANDSDWDIKKAVHKTFKNLSTEFMHKFKDKQRFMTKG